MSLVWIITQTFLMMTLASQSFMDGFLYFFAQESCMLFLASRCLYWKPLLKMILLNHSSLNCHSHNYLTSFFLTIFTTRSGHIWTLRFNTNDDTLQL